jgi:Zn-dependent peptidase ImmA (M78 family)/DNA-binding XRE family transcriptional regulator
MKNFPERLKNARKMKGFSLQELAEALGNQYSKQALNRMETGESLPDSAFILKLSQVLGVSADYFSKTDLVELTQIDFRKLTRLRVKEQEVVKSKTVEYLDRYLELEDIVGEKKVLPFIPKSFLISEPTDIESAAIEMRSVLKIGTDPIYNIVELLEENGVKVFPIQSEPSFSGMSTVLKNGEGVIVYNQLKDEIPLVRIRFTLLHELGHLFLNLGHFNEKEAERLCDQFAGAMLIPKENLVNLLGNKRMEIMNEELRMIKRYYGISLPAIVYRAKTLGIVSDSFVKYFMIRYNKTDGKSKEFQGYNGDESASRFLQILLRAVGNEVITISKAASLYSMRLAEFRTQFLDEPEDENSGR